MSAYVARTCTEVSTNAFDPQPLSHFRERRAYVLLGDPGSGKTTEFKEEAQRLGGAAEYVSARKFIRDSLEAHPEWRDKTLFVDGLDERRAGTTDLRTPLDQIIQKLGQLERPKFRISCREADWLGLNDRQNLEDVTPGTQLTVLRLDPLSYRATTDLLRSLGMSDSRAEEFIQEASDQGLDVLLVNPLTLRLLADAVDQGGGWPKSRSDTFELACQWMAREQNPEHLLGTGSIPTESVLYGAGYLSALHLLADVSGFSSTPIADADSPVHLDELEGLPSLQSPHCLERALKTKMFTGVDGQGRSPLHRHIAEYLAGRYLANLIKDGLPASRVVALMTSPSDGRVATELRGLSAWLAARSPEARRQVIDADPVGVGLYGDISEFSLDQKEHLMESLIEFATQGQLYVYQQPDGRHDGYRSSPAEAFRPLASAEMASAIKLLLSDLGTEPQDHRILEFICDVLSEADDSALGSLADLIPDLEASVRDPARPPLARRLALNALIRIAPPGSSTSHTFTRLLDEFHNRKLTDPDDDLRGTLLGHLYPTWLAPSQVWRYIQPIHRPNYFGRFGAFWHYDLLVESSDQQIAELLDTLHEDRLDVMPALERSGFKRLALQLLARGLEVWGDRLDPFRLYSWLNTSTRSQGASALTRESDQEIRDWLEARPEVQKSVFLAWVRQHESHGRFELHEYWNCNALHWSTPPPDFGLWCLEQAIELADSEPSVSQELLRQSYHSLEKPEISEGLSLVVIGNRTRGHSELARLIDQLRNPPPPNNEMLEIQRERRERIATYQEEERQQQAKWGAELRSREAELRENRFSPPNLHTLANVYFGSLGGSDPTVPAETSHLRVHRW